jgi:hypothetical protein
MLGEVLLIILSFIEEKKTGPFSGLDVQLHHDVVNPLINWSDWRYSNKTEKKTNLVQRNSEK